MTGETSHPKHGGHEGGQRPRDNMAHTTTDQKRGNRARADRTADFHPASGTVVRAAIRPSGTRRLQRAWDNYADTYLLDINAGEGSLDVRDDFTLDRDTIAVTWGNANPLIVEIGTGQGENIVAAAAAHPDVNFLALEVYDPGVAHTLLLAGKQRLGNLRIAQVNAPELLAATAPAPSPRSGRSSPTLGRR